MKRLALQDRQTPEIEALAHEAGDVDGLERLLREVWLFVPDPEHAEYVNSPVWQYREAFDFYLETGAILFTGDCDDAATLAASVLSALEIPCWFEAIRFPGNPEFEHVYICARRGFETVIIDPVVPPADLPIPGVEEIMELPVWPPQGF